MTLHILIVSPDSWCNLVYCQSTILIDFGTPAGCMRIGSLMLMRLPPFVIRYLTFFDIGLFLGSRYHKDIEFRYPAVVISFDWMEIG